MQANDRHHHTQQEPAGPVDKPSTTARQPKSVKNRHRTLRRQRSNRRLPAHHHTSLTDEQTNNRRNLQLLAEAEQCFQSLADFRQRRQRAVDYYRGRQWGDLVTEDGRQMTEDQYLRREGRIPLKQNMIRPPLRNLIGQYRSNAANRWCLPATAPTNVRPR